MATRFLGGRADSIELVHLTLGGVPECGDALRRGELSDPESEVHRLAAVRNTRPSLARRLSSTERGVFQPRSELHSYRTPGKHRAPLRAAAPRLDIAGQRASPDGSKRGEPSDTARCGVQPIFRIRDAAPSEHDLDRVHLGG